MSPHGALLLPHCAWDHSKHLASPHVPLLAQPAPASGHGPRKIPVRWWHSVSGFALSGQGSLPTLSLLRGLVSGWGPTRSLQTPRGQGTPRARLCQGLRWERAGKADSSDLNHTGRLLGRRHRLSHRCRHRAGHQGRLRSTGWAGWDPATNLFPLEQHLLQCWNRRRAMLPSGVLCPGPHPAHPRLGERTPRHSSLRQAQGEDAGLRRAPRADVGSGFEAPQAQRDPSLANAEGLCGGCAGTEG